MEMSAAPLSPLSHEHASCARLASLLTAAGAGAQAGYRLREATLLYQQGEPEGAKTMMKGIVRKYPRYAGKPPPPHPFPPRRVPPTGPGGVSTQLPPALQPLHRLKYPQGNHMREQ